MHSIETYTPTQYTTPDQSILSRKSVASYDWFRYVARAARLPQVVLLDIEGKHDISQSRVAIRKLTTWAEG